ncbi:unnamed protein product [Echinostoma caproni]|uniref:RyR domain-containing protein n=1 Tax=Echinostoma caproni TaxID=27848 RepID=A0A183AFJ9_9TREM|nr:unnamed protein product [Echinostoma caproni]
MRYIHPVTDTLKAMLALGWTIDADDARHQEASMDRKQMRRPTLAPEMMMTYTPNARDLRGVNVSKEMLNLAERLADNAHNIWARQKMSDLEAIGGGVHQLLVPYEILTDNERKRYRRLTHELIKYLQYYGYRLSLRSGSNQQGISGAAGADAGRRVEGRNATSIEEKKMAATAILKMGNAEDFVRSRLLPFFVNCADDLCILMRNLEAGRYSHVKGTIKRGACSVDYVHMVLLPVLKSMFEHLSKNECGDDLLDVLFELSKTLTGLHDIIQQVELLADSGVAGAAEAPHLIEVTLPMLCSYLPTWWRKGPECRRPEATVEELTRAPRDGREPRSTHTEEEMSSKIDRQLSPDAPLTRVTADLMNRVLGSVLQLIQNNIDSPHAPWMTRIATRTQPIVANSTTEMLGQYFLPVSERLLEHALVVEKVEELFKAEKRSGSETVSEREEELSTLVEVLVRNLFAFYPLLIKFVDRHRSAWLKHPTQETQRLFTAVARMFLVWTRASKFKREEENFVSAHEIDHLSLIVPSGGSSVTSSRSRPSVNGRADTSSVKPSLSQLGGREQELVLCAKRKLIRSEADADIEAYLSSALDREEDFEPRTQRWQKLLYQKIDKTIALTGRHAALETSTKEETVDRILTLSKVMHGLYLVDHPPTLAKGAWKKLVSSQRKRAVMACFRMVPLYALPVHRAVNLFINAYVDEWLNYEESLGVKLIEDITRESDDSAEANSTRAAPEGTTIATVTSPLKADTSSKLLEDTAANSALEFMDSVLDLRVPVGGVENEMLENAPPKIVLPTPGSDAAASTCSDAVAAPDPLTQLLTALSRSAMDQAPDDPLYLAYAKIMGKSCSGEDEEDEEEAEEEEGTTFEDQEEQKLQLLSEQNRLADRGAAEMVLLQLAASRGTYTRILTSM